MKVTLLLFTLFFIPFKVEAQQDLAYLISVDVCNCLGKSKDTSKAVYNKCYADIFIKYQQQISTEYHLTKTSSYEAAKDAGKKMRIRVESFLNRNCSTYEKYKKVNKN